RGRTERIAVREGTVLFRRRGAAPLRLAAGMVWSAGVDAEPPHAPQAAPSAPAQAATPPLAVVPEKAALRAAQPRRVVRKPPSAQPVPPTSTPVTEDAAYLQVLALLREGRTEEAKLAAARYVQNFPNGFRRVEMQRLAAP